MIVEDVFPARVRFADGSAVRPARVVVDDEGRAVILTDERGTVEVVARAVVTDVQRQRRSRETLMSTAGGESWSVTIGGGCGCGSPLRRADAEAYIAEGSYA